MQCPKCGAPGEGRFCAQCGTELTTQSWDDSEDRFWQQSPAGPRQEPPAGPPSRRRIWPVAVLLVAVLAIAGTALWFVTAPDDRVEAQRTSSGSGTESSSTQTSSTSEDAATDTTTTTTTTTTSSSSSTTPPVDAQLETTRQSALGRAHLDGRYAVTLSSKMDGQRDEYQTTASGSHVFRLADILALHEDLVDEYGDDGDVYLFTDQDLASTADKDYGSTMWMTVLDPGGLESKEDALDWCENAFAHQTDEERANSCGSRRLETP